MVLGDGHRVGLRGSAGAQIPCWLLFRSPRSWCSRFASRRIDSAGAAVLAYTLSGLVVVGGLVSSYAIPAEMLAAVIVVGR